MSGDVVLLALHALSTCVLAGIGAAVHLVVYPALRAVGPLPGWHDAHDAHSRRMVGLLALPWPAQGLAVALLLAVRPPAVPLPLLLAAAILAAAPVAITVAVAVPCHQRLGDGYDEAVMAGLQRADTARALTWLAGAVVATAMLAMA